MVTTIKGELQIDHGRGVIYFHSTDPEKFPSPSTLLRICSLPRPIPDLVELEKLGSMLDITHMQDTSWKPVAWIAIGVEMVSRMAYPLAIAPTKHKAINGTKVPGYIDKIEIFEIDELDGRLKLWFQNLFGEHWTDAMSSLSFNNVAHLIEDYFKANGVIGKRGSSY